MPSYFQNPHVATPTVQPRRWPESPIIVPSARPPVSAPPPELYTDYAEITGDRGSLFTSRERSLVAALPFVSAQEPSVPAPARQEVLPGAPTGPYVREVLDDLNRISSPKPTAIKADRALQLNAQADSDTAKEGEQVSPAMNSKERPLTPTESRHTSSLRRQSPTHTEGCGSRYPLSAVTIGRVEVRAIMPAEPAPRSPTAA